MKLLFWIVGVPLLLLAAFFAVANREAVTVSLWPFAEPLQTPLFVAIVAPLYAGVVIGAVAAWWSGRRARSRARAEARRAESLQRENAGLKARIEALEAARQPAPPPSIDRSLSALPPSFVP